MTPELNWPWSTITAVIVWKLAPKGVILTKMDLYALPEDRVLAHDREVDCNRFRWVTLLEKECELNPVPGTKPPASNSFLDGRWQKTAVVLLWKLAKDGLTLTPQDRADVPGHLMLDTRALSEPSDAVELRFVPREQAARIIAWEKDNEGRIVL